jgi:hypothetical protein
VAFQGFDVRKPSAFTAAGPKHGGQIKDQGKDYGEDERRGRMRLQYGTPKRRTGRRAQGASIQAAIQSPWSGTSLAP